MDAIDSCLKKLDACSIYSFSEWPNPRIPRVAAGVYAIYNGDQFIYVGMAGAGLDDATIQLKLKANKKSGLVDRLGSHASGQRSGDRFCLYICDSFILPMLTPDEIIAVADQKLNLDHKVRQYVKSNLHYRFVVTEASIARSIEKHIQLNGLNGQLPTINHRKRQSDS